MRNSSHWAHRQGKRVKAVAYGCYLPDDEPNPLDVERDGQAVEKQAAADARKEARQVIAGIKQSSKGAALVGKWEPAT